MPGTRRPMLDAAFPFEGNMCASAFTLEQLKVLDDLMVAYAIMDFNPAGPDEICIWANEACQQQRNKSLIDMQRDKKSQASAAMLKFYSHVHDRVQMQRSEMRMIKTIFPNDAPLQLYMCLRPIRMVEKGRSRIVALQTGIPIPNDDECREASVSIEMLTNYTENIQIVFDAQSGRATTGNLKDQMEEARKQLQRLNLKSVPYEMIARKTAADSRWHKLVWSPAQQSSSSSSSSSSSLNVMLSEYDISELKQAHEELERLNDQQDLSFASISHELRTPLNGVLGLTDTMLGDPACPVHFRKSLAVVMSQARRLNMLVDDILDAASSRRGTLTVKRGTVNLREVVQDVCLMMVPLLKTDIELKNEVQSMEFLPMIDGDENRVAQIFINLIGNAIKFTQRGTITVRAELDTGGNVLVHIQDTGPGIPEDKLPKIWGATGEADSTGRQQHGGAGLGLSLVKTLVEAHRGRIWATSECGGRKSGTKVSFSLPIVGTASEEEEEGQGDGERVGVRAKILQGLQSPASSRSNRSYDLRTASDGAIVSERRTLSGSVVLSSDDESGEHEPAAFLSLQNHRDRRMSMEGNDPRRRASMDGMPAMGVGGTGWVVGTGQFVVCPRCSTEAPSHTANFCHNCGALLPGKEDTVVVTSEERAGSGGFASIGSTRDGLKSLTGPSRTLSSVVKRTPKRALLIVDLQNDFAAWGPSGNGSMSAPGRIEAVHNTNALRNAFHFDVVALTRDWHPHNHCSFWSNHEGAEVLQVITLKYADGTELDQVLWPVHCVQGGWGSNFCDELEVRDTDIIIDKGTNVDVDSYSGFFDNGRRQQTTLQRQLKEAGVSEVYCVGIALDYCVGSTAVDAAQCGFTSYIVEDCSKMIADESWDVMKHRLAENGVEIIDSSQVPMEARETTDREESMRTEIAQLLQRVRELEDESGSLRGSLTCRDRDVETRDQRLEVERRAKDEMRRALEEERRGREEERRARERLERELSVRHRERTHLPALDAAPPLSSSAQWSPPAAASPHRSQAQHLQATIAERMLEHETLARQAAEKREEATWMFRQREQQCWNSLLATLVGDGDHTAAPQGGGGMGGDGLGLAGFGGNGMVEEDLKGLMGKAGKGGRVGAAGKREMVGGALMQYGSKAGLGFAAKDWTGLDLGSLTVPGLYQERTW